MFERSVTMSTATRPGESIVSFTSLLLAFELGERTWKLGFSAGLGQRPRIRVVTAGDVARVREEIGRAKQRFGLSITAPVVSCYEAGREAFWLHRYLIAHGIDNRVIDSSSIEVNRRARRAKTDRLDLGGLLNLLARWLAGDRRVWRVVRVPTVAEEDARHLSRAIETSTSDRTRVINRIKALLTTHGVKLRLDRAFLDALDAVQLWDGAPLPGGLRQRLRHEWHQLQAIEAQRRELVRMRAQPDQTPCGRLIDHLQTLRAVGPTGASVLVTEIFAWRQIRNRRQLGALVGLVPTPYQSGTSSFEQGITRAGNAHVRRVMVQLAWGWLRFQPTSALSQWYRHRFDQGGMRLRKIGIVALARKLLIALWRYVDAGVIPDGAMLKPAIA
jgi:transposase